MVFFSLRDYDLRKVWRYQKAIRSVNRKMVNTMTKRKRTNNNLHSNTQRTNHWETYVCVNIQNIMINCNTIYTNWIPIILFISKSITLIMQSFLSEFISSNIEKIKHKTNNPNLATIHHMVVAKTTDRRCIPVSQWICSTPLSGVDGAIVIAIIDHLYPLFHKEPSTVNTKAVGFTSH